MTPRLTHRLTFLFVLGAFFFASGLDAAQRSASDVQAMVRGWLNFAESSPLHARLSDSIASVKPVWVGGEIAAYAVALAPEGFVIAAADDSVEPVIAFSRRGQFDLSEAGPLQAFLERDMPGRLAHARAQPVLMALGADTPERTKWRRYLGEDSGASLLVNSGLSENPADLRVAPLVQSRWSQSSVGGRLCYNAFTPNNYVCGCTPAAAAQLMRYYNYPVAAVGRLAGSIEVDGVARTAYTRGGDGSGGAYRWDLMPYVPGSAHSAEQLEAIGALTHDLGVAFGASYAEDGTGTYLPPEEMKNVFGYASIYRLESGVDRTNAINANLDAGWPVILFLPGHAVICDGYGFQDGTAYHHLNMGWGGYEDTWYTIGNLYAGSYVFNGLTYVYANISPDTTGEILSGRVTDGSGEPISGVSVTLSPGGATALTDSAGIYAFTGLTPNGAYGVTAEKSGYAFSPRSVVMGKTVGYSIACGNRWGQDFAGVMEGDYGLASGTVRTAAGDGVAGITVVFTPGGSVQTGPTGFFSQTLPLGWSGTVTLALNRGYGTPASQSLSLTGSLLADVDFTITQMVFVKAGATGAGTGASWSDAYPSLVTALENTPASEEIWVAAGTYTPAEGSRNNSFSFSPGQRVFGGFAGTETHREARNWLANRTILSGDIGTKGVAADNCYNVVYGAADGLLDGFTVTGGYGESYVNSGYIKDFAPGRGAGAHVWAEAESASFVLNHCIVSNNYAAAQGGGIFGCIARNSIFTGNRGIYAAGYRSVFENCTVTGNTTEYEPSLSGIVRNCIIYNEARVKTNTYGSGPLTMTNSSHNFALWSYFLFSDSTGNIIGDPAFANLPAMPFAVSSASPCLNKGAVLPWMEGAVDFFGDARVSGAAPDLGAYEFQANLSEISLGEAAVAPALSPEGVKLSIRSRYGWTYELKRSASLESPAWSTAAQAVGDGSVKALIDSAPPAGKQFYKITARQ